MTHSIKKATITFNDGSKTELYDIKTNKSIKQFKEELLDNMSHYKCFIAMSCEFTYY